MSENLNDVRNWPNLVFKFLLSVVGGGVFIMLTSVYGELKEFRVEIVKFRSDLFGSMKDFQYLKEDYVELKSEFHRHVEESEKEKREFRREIEALKYQNRTK